MSEAKRPCYEYGYDRPLSLSCVSIDALQIIFAFLTLKGKVAMKGVSKTYTSCALKAIHFTRAVNLECIEYEKYCTIPSNLLKQISLCKNLQEIKFHPACTSTQIVPLIIQFSQTLEKLSVCAQVDSYDDVCILQATCTLPHLRSLELNAGRNYCNLDIGDVGWNLRQFAVQMLLAHSQKLECLKVVVCNQSVLYSLLQVTSTFKHLATLSIRSVYQMRDRDTLIRELVDNSSTTLDTLYIQYPSHDCSRSDIFQICRAFPSLKTLKFMRPSKRGCLIEDSTEKWNWKTIQCAG